MDSAQAWAIIAEARWSEDFNYSRIKNELMAKLSVEEVEALSKFIEDKRRDLHRAIKNGELEDSLGYGDSYSDLLYHVVGLGKEEYEKCLNDIESVVEVSKTSRECFGYGIPDKEDYDRLDPSYFRQMANRFLTEMESVNLSELPISDSNYKKFHESFSLIKNLLQNIIAGDFSSLEADGFVPTKTGYSSVSNSELYIAWDKARKINDDIFHYGFANMISDFNNAKTVLNNR
jgi:hypothetical protein